MPFKRTADPEDYPERFQKRRSWVEDHQEDNLKDAIGPGLWAYLEKLEKEIKCLDI